MENNRVKRFNEEVEQLSKTDGYTAVIHWVDVEKQLPMEHQDILVYYYSNRYSKYFPNLKFMKQTSFYNNRFECEEEVTHWAELPKPPCL